MKWTIDEVKLLICKFDGKLVYLDTANLRILKILEIGMTKTLHQKQFSVMKINILIDK